MTNHPVTDAVVNGQQVVKGTFRSAILQNVLALASVAELRAMDTQGVAAVLVDGTAYRYDSADTTSTDNGATVIIDLSGTRRFKRVSSTAPALIGAGGGGTRKDAVTGFGPANGPPVTGAAGGANFLYMSRLVVGRPDTYTRLRARVTTAGAASTKSRFGLYAVDPASGYPSTLVLDTGEIAVDATGVVAATIALAVAVPTEFWLAHVTNAAAVVFEGFDPTHLQPIGSFYVGTTATVPRGLYKNQTYGALPADLSAVAYTGVASTGWVYGASSWFPRAYLGWATS